MTSVQKYIRWFSEVDKNDISLVGGKGANLGEMISFGIPVPLGFIITAPAYFYFLKENQLEPQIKKNLQLVDENDPYSFNVVSEKIKRVILEGRIPKDLGLEIMKAYLELGFPRQVPVAVRSSATAEDLPTASFAGQQATFLNVTGEVNVLKKVHQCWASLFEPRAIFYRQQKNINQLNVGIAVPVQKMIPSEVSGVMFTVDPVTYQKNRILIEAIYGLGELVVQGAVIPDRYLVDKNTFEILQKEISKQPVQLISASGGSAFGGKVGNLNKQTKIPTQKQDRQKLTDKQIVQLAKLGKKIQQHYFFPQDIEWALEKGKIYILQTRPVTTLPSVRKTQLVVETEKIKRVPILSGIPASPGIASGMVRIIHSPKEINKVKKGEILVTPMTTPDFVPVMKKVAAIVTDKGGQTSHAAIVSRELGIPCVVGTQKATQIFKNGQILTVNGKNGQIYQGGFLLPRKEEFPTIFPSQTQAFLKTATKVYVNLAEPELAKEIAQRNVDGIGLLRSEFMVAQIGIHPKKLIHERKQNLFTKQMTEWLSIFCEQFKPRPVIYRATDFKTNEYRNLVGGRMFEPEEPNPLLGFRGAFRFLADPEVFELELAVIKKVRQEFKNLHLMIPFVHQPWELNEVKKIVAASGLLRSPSFKIWLMVEIPSNVILLEDFLRVGIDGISIGSNDLTMLVLGIDRDNSEVSQIFNENDPAVLWAIERVIKICHQYQVPSSICGQAPSFYPELVEKLVEWGITSISVNPDVIEQVRETVYEAERKLLNKKGRI